jgi:hypothetical protein
MNTQTLSVVVIVLAVLGVGGRVKSQGPEDQDPKKAREEARKDNERRLDKLPHVSCKYEKMTIYSDAVVLEILLENGTGHGLRINARRLALILRGATTLTGVNGEKWSFLPLKSTYHFAKDSMDNTLALEPKTPLRLLLVDKLESPRLGRAEKTRTEMDVPKSFQQKTSIGLHLSRKELDGGGEDVHLSGEGTVPAEWKRNAIPDDISTRVMK